MFKYQNIFWLDDRPNVIAHFVRNINKNSGKNSENFSGLESLLSRVTLAYDFSMGKELFFNPLNGEYDLIILDGDFPFYSNKEYKKEVDKCVEKMTRGEWTKEENVDMELLDLNYDVPFNFFNFYKECLEGNTEAKTVVFSANEYCSFFAYQLDIPFFLKALDTKSREIKNTVKEISKKELEYSAKRITNFKKPCRDLSGLGEWECGDVNDLAKKYLYKKTY